MNPEKTKKIEKWWDEHPFTYGLSKSGDLVGRVPVEEMDLFYFSEIERKYKKHHMGGAHTKDGPILSKLIDYAWLNGKKVLDIAVGSGVTAVAFADAGADVVGIDIADYAVQQTRRNFQVRGLKGRIVKMDGQNLELENESFNFVNAWGCFMHMPDTQQAINEAFRVLKPGGRLLAYMYNKSSWPFWFNTVFLRGILLGRLLYFGFDIERLSARYTDGVKSGGNLKATYYTPRQAERLFSRAGFTKIKSFPLALPHEPNSWPMRKFPLFKFLPKKVKTGMAHRWGKGLIIQAEKQIIHEPIR